MNKIYKLDVFEFLKRLENKSIDLAIIDPPYNLKIAPWDEFKNENDFLGFTFAWLDLMLEKMKANGSFYIFNTPYNCALILSFLHEKNIIFQNWITWYKKDGFAANKKRFNNNQESILFYTMGEDYYFDCEAVRVEYLSQSRMAHAAKNGIVKNNKRWYPNPRGKLCPDVWEISSQRHKNKIKGRTQKPSHPSIKPREMIERIIKASSKEGDVILDLFSGSGMSSLVARDLGRKFIGCELNDYVDSSLDFVQPDSKTE